MSIRQRRSGSCGENSVLFGSMRGVRRGLEFERKQLLIPVGPSHRPVHHQAESLDLRQHPLVAKDDRDLRNAELGRRLQPEMAIDDLTIASHEAWDLESELADRGTHTIHGAVVLTRVTRIFDELIDWSVLNLRDLSRWQRKHNLT